MLPRRSHTLAPLTKLISIKIHLQMDGSQTSFFENIKWIVAHYTLLTYPDFNETFRTHTDSIEFQLGAVISQNGKPIIFYIRKLTDAQQRYKVTER